MLNAQLPLAIQLRGSATFDAFVPGPNTLLLQILQGMVNADSERQLYFWGGAGVGKTHLLQAVCHKAATCGLTATFLSLRDLLAHGTAVLDDLSVLDMICLDDVEILAGHRQWETALFNLINEVRAANCRLIMTATANIPVLEIELKDLVSRLAWGPVFQLKDISDAEKIEVLQKRASAKGMELGQDVARFMLRHYRRNMASLCAQLDYLDQISLAAQRKLTIPFIKSVMVQYQS